MPTHTHKSSADGDPNRHATLDYVLVSPDIAGAIDGCSVLNHLQKEGWRSDHHPIIFQADVAQACGKPMQVYPPTQRGGWYRLDKLLRNTERDEDGYTPWQKLIYALKGVDELRMLCETTSITADNAVSRFESVIRQIEGIVKDQPFMTSEYLEEKTVQQPRSTQSTRAAAAQLVASSLAELHEHLSTWSRRHRKSPFNKEHAKTIDVVTMISVAKARGLIEEAQQQEREYLTQEEGGASDHSDNERADDCIAEQEEAASDGVEEEEGAQSPYRAYFLDDAEIDHRRRQLAKKVMPILSELDDIAKRCETNLRSEYKRSPRGDHADLTGVLRQILRAKEDAEAALGRILGAETQDNIQARLESRDWDTVHDVARFYGKVSEKDFKNSSHMTYMHTTETGEVQAVRESEEVKKRWADAYATQFSASRDPPMTTGYYGGIYNDFYQPLPQQKQADLSKVLQKVTFREMKDLIKAIPNKSSPGPDGFQSVFLKACPEYVTEFMAEVYSHFMSSNTIPPRFLQQIIVCVPKSEAKPLSDPTNQRPLALCNDMYKLFERVLKNRTMTALRRKNVLSRLQEGSVPGGTCHAHLSAVADIISDANRRGDELHATIYDFSKAFDNVPFSVVADALRRVGADEALISFYYTLMSGRTAKIWTGHGYTRDIKVERSTIQGSVCGPMFFLLACDPLLDKLDKMGGYRMNNGTDVPGMGFVDDLVTFANTLQKAQQQARIVERYAKVTGQRLNASKTVYATNQGVRQFAPDPLSTFGTSLPTATTIHTTPSKQIREASTNAPDYDSEHGTTKCLHLEGKWIKPIPHYSRWRYLGIWFRMDLSWEDQRSIMVDDTERLLTRYGSMLLRPKQARYVINTILPPKLTYVTTVADVGDDIIDQIDTKIRKAVRSAVRISNSTANPAVYHKGIGLGTNTLRAQTDIAIVELETIRMNSDPRLSITAATGQDAYLSYLQNHKHPHQALSPHQPQALIDAALERDDVRAILQEERDVEQEREHVAQIEALYAHQTRRVRRAVDGET